MNVMNVKFRSALVGVCRNFLFLACIFIQMCIRSDVGELSLMGIQGAPVGVPSLSADVYCGGKQ